jgi:hypothetical protein
MEKGVEGSGSRVIRVRQANCHGICLEGVREKYGARSPEYEAGVPTTAP